MNILGKHVVLRAIEAADLPALHRWSNAPDLQRMLGGWHFPTSMRDQETWLSTLSCRSTDQRFAIDLPGHGLVGTANLVGIQWKDRNAFHGMYLGDPALRGKGYGVDTVMAVMRYAFDELGLARLDTDIVEYNTPSLRAYVERCGWTLEGTKAKACHREGRFWSKHVLGITDDAYRAHAAKLRYWD